MSEQISKIELEGVKKFSNAENDFYLAELVGNAQIVLEEAAQVQLIIFAKADSKKLNLSIELGKDSNLEILEIVLGGGDNHYQQNWKIVHQGRNARSRFYLKSVMKGNSDLDFLGDVFIPESGQGGDTYLRFQSLLLSEGSRAKAIPALEIIANEVKAGHAAAIGRVDDELLFYLESRGFDRTDAEQMLVEAFLKDGLKQLSSIGDEKMLELERILMEKIDGRKVYSS